ncbi:MAG: rhamnulokinase [Planctomycetota bacterium]|nr:rhamnulokinase [Planctomycetota bacterium]
MAEKKFLAFDIGAESGRAIIGTLSDARLTLEEKHRFANPSGKINGHFHWSLLGQWEELKTGLRKAARSLGSGKLSGIGVDTWGVDFGLLDRNGDILGNPFMYRDPRTDGVMDKVFQRVPRQKVFAATGIQFLPFNSLFQLYAMKLANSPLLMMADKLLFVPDLFHYLFTGVKKNEFSIATTSQFYDPAKKAWASDLLKQLELPTSILCDIVPAGTILGELKKDVADECGVAGIPVITPASHDTGSAVAAVPAEGDAWCYISSGTWSLMGVELPTPIINDKSLKYNYTNEGGVNGTIRFLKNIMGMWPVQECRRQWLKEGREYSYGELTRLATDAKPFLTLLNPDHPPFLTPGEMPRKIEEFCRKTNQAAPSSAGDFVRACLEGLALTYRKTLEGLEDVLGKKIRVIHIVGGGCQNDLLNQMTADACARPVLAGPVEATAIGNLLVQAMATGDVKSLAEVRSIIAASFDLKRYEPRDTATWDKAYLRYQEIL